jgi:hypothetical protein
MASLRACKVEYKKMQESDYVNTKQKEENEKLASDCFY